VLLSVQFTRYISHMGIQSERERCAFALPELRERSRALILLFRCDSTSVRRRSRHSSLVTRHLVRRHEPNAFTLPELRERARAFTLIEVLVVITIIIILMAFLLPAFRGVQNQAKRTQAKNDLTQIVTAVNAYYTEYGKYPVTTQGDDTQAIFKADNSDVMYTLRAIAFGANASDALNPRKIVFISPPDVKDPTNPRAGVASTGIYYDPWGKDATKPESGVYHIAMDGNYDGTIANPYGNNNGAGTDPIRQGVIAWSFGSDGKLGNNGDNIFTNSDDVISWQ
jgi:type II secretory pathway pseudopilin PulG